LASGLLTGKYRQGIPQNSRGALEGMGFLVDDLTDGAKNAAVTQLDAVASDLGCSLSQLAIAWVAKNPRGSTVITGASKVTQLTENLGALEVMPKLMPDVMARIDEVTSALAG
jgi:aryl-alcohol dehydrogenase-like predicted oxidoreductase